MAKPDSTPLDLAPAKQALASAVAFSWDIAKADGHWNGELKSNVTITAEHVLFYQSLPRAKKEIPDAEAYRRYLLGEQQDDGSWTIAPGYAGDLSASVEAYLALKILGEPASAPAMQRARSFVLRSGGVAGVRVFTRYYLAMFGLFPWAVTPQLPAEFILFPASAPLSLYRLSSWARSTVVPLLLIAHHRPIYELPNGRSADNTFLDELWLRPHDKRVPLGPPLLAPWMWSSSEGGDLEGLGPNLGLVAYGFALADRVLGWAGGLLRHGLLRARARRRCVQWLVDHQEPSGDWAGIVPPMHGGVQALLLEGFSLDSGPVRRGIEALERFTVSDDDRDDDNIRARGYGDSCGKRLQSCVSPVWDTVLMVRGLCDAGVDGADERLRQAVRWTTARQLLGPQGDWRIFRPDLTPGGWSFEYHNAWYPDVDDTAAAVLALLGAEDTTEAAGEASAAVTRAVAWLCGMQNKDGGWAAFDVANDRLWLNRIPFSDMDSLCDPSTADVTGRVLEALGRVLAAADRVDHDRTTTDPALLAAAATASARAIAYLQAQQLPTGAWFGRWGANYVYGTSNVLCGLAYFTQSRNGREGHNVRAMMAAGAAWLRRMQNADGGWGEDLQSYRWPSQAGRGPSTPSQTAWGLMGLLAAAELDDNDVDVDDDAAVRAGVAHLVSTQTDKTSASDSGASWPEWCHTGTGFPNHFYIGYTLYRHYFPMMALGRFVAAVEKKRATQ